MAKDSEEKKLYDWECDPELTTHEPKNGQKSFGEELNEILTMAAMLTIAFFVLVVMTNYFFGSHTYFVSYNYTLVGQELFWGSGQTFVSYSGKVNTSNYNSFIKDTKKTVEKELGKEDGKSYNAVIISYQEVPRTIKDFLSF